MDRRRFLAAGAWAAAALNFRSRESAALAIGGELAAQRIAAIETKSFPLPWPRHVGRNAKRDHHGTGPTIQAVVLKTDQGAVGWGECRGGAAAVEPLRERVIGKPVSALFVADSGIVDPALQPLDIALHDLAGVILNVPVWKLLGAERPHLFPVYSGMIYFDDLDPEQRPGGIDQVLRNCAADRAAGYRQLKVKIGRGNMWMPPEAGLRRDIEVVRAIAEAFPDCQLLVDGNDGFTPESMIAFLKGIDGVPLVWIEEPFVENDADWRKLHAWTRANGRDKTLLADGEQGNDYPVLERLEADGILQVRLCDIISFGFTRWRALMPRLRQTGTQASPHAWGNFLKTIYAAHLVGGLGNAPTIEGVPQRADQPHVDFGEHVIRDGKLQLSTQPGFGVRLLTG